MRSENEAETVQASDSLEKGTPITRAREKHFKIYFNFRDLRRRHTRETVREGFEPSVAFGLRRFSKALLCWVRHVSLLLCCYF
jgi:hypothetical protein